MAELPSHSALLTDLYELTMAAAYFDNRFEARASFELFVRHLPPTRGYLLIAGLEQALEFLEQLQFSPSEIDFLRSHPMFGHVSSAFFDYLKSFRFTGDVWAVPEGTPIFSEEPIVRVTAPIIEAQVVETYLLASICFPTLVATKAARLIEGAQGHSVVEFGSRRAQGPEAGLLAARASYIGGCAGTSNVEAGMRFGIPVYGTVAHSYVMAHGHEEDAFRDFERIFSENSTLLVDTYDTLAAIDKIIALGMKPVGVRLDSGNLAELAKQVRQRLDAAGLQQTKIFISGDLDEFSITRLLAQKAPADIFAVGTALSTSKDEPALGGVYKLVEVTPTGGARRYTSKFSADKATWPGCKQVFRFADANGMFCQDVLGCEDERHENSLPVLEPVMRAGRRIAPSPSLTAIRERARQLVGRLPLPVRELHEPLPYPVRISNKLQGLREEVRKQLR